MNLPHMNVIMLRVMYVCMYVGAYKRVHTHAPAEKRARARVQKRDGENPVASCCYGDASSVYSVLVSVFLSFSSPPSLSFSLNLSQSPSLSLPSFLPFVLHFCSFIRCISPPSLPLPPFLPSHSLTHSHSPTIFLSVSLPRFLAACRKNASSWPAFLAARRVDVRQLSTALMIQKGAPEWRGGTSSCRDEKRRELRAF